ncbi:cytochrome bd-I oxidase subunit CydX [Ancylobacter amanitiformis]|uniref:Cyd operon protein YbgT n=1 Tax=Ancylobacter amanitiformis TaxID=217069 RepID=A0ABU0LMG1_9HYPH|nr:cytochrome bd-I oxidase subunit CydX [Ancylobacter amanitiformis]MDQ0509867.1 cyd operon protein YbgT [Ancylobacter amanitiformis]
MWYFAWLLGLPLAAAFAVLNAMWYELIDDAKRAGPAVRAAPVRPAPAAARRRS